MKKKALILLAVLATCMLAAPTETLAGPKSKKKTKTKALKLCHNTSTGAVAAKGTCSSKKGEVQIDFAALKGNAGDTGPQGEAGPAGSQGTAGSDGADGAGGADGAQGPGGPSNFFTGGLQVSTGNPDTNYFLPSGFGTVEQNTQESQVRMPLASACTATNLVVRTSMGAGGPASITLRQNQADTALTCTHADNMAGPGAGCSSSAQVSLSQGDELSFRWTGDLGNADRVWVSWTCE